MRLTYGDLSETDLDFDPLALTRAVVEYACDVMRAAQRVEHRRAAQSRAGAQARSYARDIDARRQRLRALVATEFPGDDLGDDVDRAVGDALTQHVQRRRDAADREQRRLDDEIAYERQQCLEALAPLLCRFDLPGTVARLELRNDVSGYRATLSASTELATGDLTADFALDAGAAFASRDRTVNAFTRATNLRVPVRGWFGRRRVKLRDLGSCVVASVTHSGDGTTVLLRSTARHPVEYRLERTDEGLELAAADARPIGRLALVGADAQATSDLIDAITAAAIPLAERRTRLLGARLSGTSVTELCDVEIVALGLIDTVAPVVRELWARSPGDEELVVGVPARDGTVVEQRLSLAALRDALAPLDSNQRGAFSAWDLPLYGAPVTRDRAPRSGRLARGSAPPPPRLPSPVPERSAARPREPEAPRLSTVDLDSGWA